MTSTGAWSRKQLNYEFKEPALLEQALTHKSLSATNNERLEFLGDAVLSFVIAEALYTREPDINEGELSRKRSLLVKGQTLTEIARETGLHRVVKLSPAEQRSGGHQRRAVLEDALEAVFGAILLDGGVEAAKSTILELFAERLDLLPAQAETRDAKSRLQETLQAMRLELPLYTIEHEEGPDHAREFEIACVIAECNIQTTGRGTSRQAAEQEAAAQALLLLADDS
ncbi:MAG: ribonuclease III [Gammaproteobacteria bacterium]